MIPKENGFTRKLVLWFGSYLAAAILLFFYFKAPLFPLLLGGLLTLALTWIKWVKRSDRES